MPAEQMLLLLAGPTPSPTHVGLNKEHVNEVMYFGEWLEGLARKGVGQRLIFRVSNRAFEQLVLMTQHEHERTPAFDSLSNRFKRSQHDWTPTLICN